MSRYGTITATGSTDPFTLRAGDVLNAYGTFGSGTLTLEINVAGAWYTLNKSDSTAAFSVTDDASVVIESGTLNCRLTLSGATDPDIDWTVA